MQLFFVDFTQFLFFIPNKHFARLIIYPTPYIETPELETTLEFGADIIYPTPYIKAPELETASEFRNTKNIPCLLRSWIESA